MLKLYNDIDWIHLFLGLSLFVFGYFFSRSTSKAFERSLNSHLTAHQTMLARRLMFYALFTLFVISGLHQMGFQLSVLLSAAGIFTVAIGFASQTAASNLVSGIFLLFDRPFKVGDLIEINSMTGYVESIDLLSTKIKTADNILIRIPNESMIKSAISNLNYFKTRRAEVIIEVAYETDLDKTKQLLTELAKNHELVLKSPEPSLIIKAFTNSSIALKLTCWTKSCDVFATQNTLKEGIIKLFEKENIDIPLPQMSLNHPLSLTDNKN